MIKTKRIYQEPDLSDGFRILIDRIWPSGISTEKAKVHLWLTDMAPSAGLKEWFRHNPSGWEGFKRRYWKEIEGNQDDIGILISLIGQDDVTFLYCSVDTVFNSAEALREYLGLPKASASNALR